MTYETYYQPTDADLLDWQEHCMMLDAEEMEEQDYGFYGPDEY